MTHPPLHLDPTSTLWPEELRTIDGPPVELWARGNAELLLPRPRVALVGSRAPTPYGEAQARRLAVDLAERGIVVVSGLARGIDDAAHRAVLEVGGDTIAVLGSGVDRPWPEGETARRVEADGLLLSEFTPEQGPRRHHFPLRNRLISGLCAAVVVVEAAAASGSLITARWAADQGRAVFAVPGRVDHPMSRGCHRLIREGAMLLESPTEVLEELGWDGPGCAAAGHDAEDSAATEEEPRVAQGPAAHPEGAAILDALVGDTLTAEALALRLGRDVGSVLGDLVRLELDGAVVRAPGGLFRLAHRGG